jgi:hypothetical protein
MTEPDRREIASHRLAGAPCPLVAVVLFVAHAALAALASSADVPPGSTAGRIVGTIVAATDGAPIAGASIRLRGEGSAASDQAGRFELAGLPPGTYVIEITANGYLPAERTVAVGAGVVAEVGAIALDPQPRFLSEVVVTPSHYELYREDPTPTATMTREEIATLPHFADDVFRVVRWVPGTTGEDISAQSHVRGGELNETQLFVDGLELEEAFHLKELFSLVSIIDAETVASIELSGGGFAVEFGDRMSGVTEIATTSAGGKRTSLGVSTTSLGVLSEGAFAKGRGGWLVAARRTDLDAVIGWVDPENGLEPDFNDLLAKVSYSPSERTLLSGSILTARDRTHYVEEDGRTEEEFDSTSRVGYAWLNLRTAWTPRLVSRTVLSTSSVSGDRAGWIDYEYQAGTVDDRRTYDVLGFRQDWTLDLSHRHALSWGATARRMAADYDYQSYSVIDEALFNPDGEVRVTERDLDFALDGSSYGAYVADRFKVVEPLIAELGVRWDRQTAIGEDQVSPRVNLVYLLSADTTFRAAWGFFHQSQRLDELQVGDGVTELAPAQRAEHRLVALEYRLPRGLDVRLELYQKLYTDVRPRYENLLSPIEILPELEADRILIAPERAEARGVEVTLHRASGRRWSWWVSYAYSAAEDELGGEWVPRAWDQPHAANFSITWRPHEHWSFNLSGAFHTGWPTTAVHGKLLHYPDGSLGVYPYLGPRNGERLDDYLRLDLRAGREFALRSGVLSIYLEVMNLLNRENLARPESYSFVLRPDGTLETVTEYEGSLPIIPALGVRWTF